MEKGSKPRERPKVIIVENGRVYRSLDEMERKTISELREEILKPEKSPATPYNKQPGEKDGQLQQG